MTSILVIWYGTDTTTCTLPLGQGKERKKQADGRRESQRENWNQRSWRDTVIEMEGKMWSRLQTVGPH